MNRANSPLLLLLVAAIGPAANSWSQSSFVNFEATQTNPVRLSPDGRRLFAVNTPDARLSVFDVSSPANPVLIAEIPVGVEPVSVNPLTDDEAWVINEVSDSVSIVSVSRHLVTDTLYVKDEPADVAFAGGRAFVTVSRNNEVRAFDVADHTQLAVIPLFGEAPRALAVGADGAKVYAVFALSGNRTTLIPAGQAPPQPPPVNIMNQPPQVGLIVDAADTNWSSVITYRMPNNNVVEIDTASLTVTRYFSGVSTVSFGLAVHPTSGDLYVANTQARNLVHFEPNLRGHIVDNRITRIEIGSGMATAFDLNAGLAYSPLPNPVSQAIALAQPTAVVFDQSGGFMYVASFGSDRLALVSTNGTVLARIEIGGSPGAAFDPPNKRGPRGLAYNPATRSLYVLNRIANTISVVNTLTRALVGELPVGSYDPTPAVIRNGRGFLYDARLSGSGTASCASCHVDADRDHIAWDLGDPTGTMQTVVTSGFMHEMHPMKGPMMTQTLRGLLHEEPFHWRGDRGDFLAFNPAFDSLLGGSVLSSNDITAYRDFINTIVFAPNPNQNLDRSLPANLAGADPNLGSAAFNFREGPAALACINCHRANPGTGSEAEILPAAFLHEPQPFNIPHLRNIYQKLNFSNTAGADTIAGFGLTHDGAQPTVTSFLGLHLFQTNALDSTTRSNLSAYLQCFDTGMAPAVGYTRTVTAANVLSADATNDWSLLESQAGLTNIDLIAKGTLDGKLHGLLYQARGSRYRPDTIGIAPLTRAQLQAKILAGDTLTLMGVPPGSGTRMAIDRDQDGVLDGDVSAPKLRISLVGGRSILSWPTNAGSFVLEAAAQFSAADWSPLSEVRGINGGEATVTNSIATGSRFFRLREP